MQGWKIAVVLGLTAIARTAQAEPPAKPCPAEAVPLPAELTGWNTRQPATAATSASGLARAMLKSGSAVDAALTPTADVRYAAPPGKSGEPASHGGLFTFEAAEAGTYRVAIGAAAWVDVIEAGQAIKSSAHGHGPACSGILKMVDFPLKAGSHVLQIAGNAAPTIAVMVTRLP